MIHTTIGIYSDGSYKINGVKAEHLAHHIEYNKTMRFGRALIVDGEILHTGYLSKEKVQKIIQEKNLDSLSVKTCTAPYV